MTAPAITAKEANEGIPSTTWLPAAWDPEAAPAEAADPEGLLEVTLAPEAETPDAPDLDADPEAEADPLEAEGKLEGRDMEVEATFPTAKVDPPDSVEGAEATNQLAVFTPLEMVEYVKQLEVAGIQAGAEGVTV